jgi:hypothetical protein
MDSRKAFIAGMKRAKVPLAYYSLALQRRPLLTKALTASALSGLQELLAQLVMIKLGSLRSRKSSTDASSSRPLAKAKRTVDTRVVKMALYGKIA